MSIIVVVVWFSICTCDIVKCGFVWFGPVDWVVTCDTRDAAAAARTAGRLVQIGSPAYHSFTPVGINRDECYLPFAEASLPIPVMTLATDDVLTCFYFKYVYCVRP